MAAAVSKAQIVRAMAAFAERGSPVTCARLCANGDVLLLTEAPAGALPSEEEAVDWVSFAGTPELPRPLAGRRRK